jgi:aspartyl/asparaginyl beta-hydroxylase (cupin superfamily)
VTPELEDRFDSIRAEHGQRSLDRVQAMLESNGEERDSRQRHAKWVLPGASTTPWLDPSAMPEIERVTRHLKALHPQIKEEALRLQRGTENHLTPYMHYLFPRADWNALYFFRNGARVNESVALCPATAGVLDELGDLFCPLLEMHFSVLDPKVTLPPHCDLWNFTINLHFGVDVPGDCALRVAGEARDVSEGKSLLFDYSFEHDAWNNSERTRTCLLVDVWNPQLTLAEREAVTALVTTIRKFTGE